MTRAPENGVSLLNVLVVMAAASGLVHVMLDSQKSGVLGVSRSHDIAQAEALARAGVTSAVVALRRDMITAPDADHLQEEWALAAQEPVDLAFGRFEVDIADARGRFNLNGLTAGAIGEQRIFEGLLAALDLPQALASQVIGSIQVDGPLDAVDQLVARGFSRADVTRLAPHVATLATAGPINLNSATEPVLSAVFANAAAARALMARRAANGRLTGQDLTSLGLVVPPLAGFTSDSFEVISTSQVGDARRRIARRILRNSDSQKIAILPLP